MKQLLFAWVLFAAATLHSAEIKNQKDLDKALSSARKIVVQGSIPKNWDFVALPLSLTDKKDISEFALWIRTYNLYADLDATSNLQNGGTLATLIGLEIIVDDTSSFRILASDLVILSQNTAFHARKGSEKDTEFSLSTAKLLGKLQSKESAGNPN